MQLTSIVLVALAAALSTAECIVPQIFFTSLPDSFTLSLLPKGERAMAETSTSEFSVLLDPRTPSDETASVPVLTETRIAQPTFRLENQTLIAEETGYTARLLPNIEIFPPPLQAFEFGGPDDQLVTAVFGAVYACDADGNGIVVLVPDQGMLAIPPFSMDCLGLLLLRFTTTSSTWAHWR
jgi:hypothetical protein